ncbi:MAG: hypothetical protein R3F59_08510 [Myxococcota bacterium]
MTPWVLGALLACSRAPCPGRTPAAMVTASGGDSAPLCADLARSEAERKAGLTARPPLAADGALVLEYPVVSEACITTAPLDRGIDVVYAADDGRIVGAGCDRGPDDPVRCVRGTKRVLERLPVVDCADLVGGFLALDGPVTGPTARWFGRYAPLSGAPCDADTAGTVAGSLDVEILRGPGVSDEALAQITRGAQAYWAPHGLWLRAAGEPVAVVSEHLLSGKMHELAELRAQRPDEDERHLMRELVFRDLRTFVAEHALPVREHTVVLAILPWIGEPGSIAQQVFEHLRGLTLSPWGGALDEDLRRALDLPDRFTPIVLVSAAEAASLPTGTVDVTAAHELGHALGLPHAEPVGRLMRDGLHRCVPTLTEAEASALVGYSRFR